MGLGLKADVFVDEVVEEAADAGAGKAGHFGREVEALADHSRFPVE